MKTMLKLMAATVIMSSLSGCIGYGYQQAVLTPEQREQMAYDSQRVQDTERVERAERRAGLLRVEYAGYLRTENQSGCPDRLRQRHFHYDLSAVHAGGLSSAGRPL